MEDISRRELFRIIGSSMVLTAAGSGVLSPALAQHVHAAMRSRQVAQRGPELQSRRSSHGTIF